MLNKQRAKNQIKAQKISIKLFYYWLIWYILNIGLVVFKFATTNPNISKYSNFDLIIAIMLYFQICFIEISAMQRNFLLLCQFQLSAFYLKNCLKTLTDKMNKIRIVELNQNKLNSFVHQILCDYCRILKNQKELNNHLDKNFLLYFLFSSFTIALPIVILFQDPNEKILRISNIITYFIILIIFFPPFVFNTLFTEAVSFIDVNHNFDLTNFINL